MLAFVNIKSLIYWQKGKIRDIFREKMENKMEDIHNKFIQEKNRGVAIKELFAENEKTSGSTAAAG